MLLDFLQHYAWIGTIISAIMGTGSFAVAFISNREKVWDFFKQFWPFILGLFALAGLWSLYQCGVFTSWVIGLKKLFAANVVIPMWVSLMALFIVAVGWWLFRNISIRRNMIRGKPNERPLHPLPQQPAPPQPKPKLSPESFDTRDYTEDLIDGVWWLWTYSGNTVNVPRPICPNRSCQCDLSFREDWERQPFHPNMYQMPPVPVSLHCPRCRFKQDFNTDKQQVLHGVSQEILSRIRTGRFRGILYNRAMNQQDSRN